MTKPRTRIASVVRTVTATALIGSLALAGAAVGTNVASAARVDKPTDVTITTTTSSGQRGQLVDHVPLRRIDTATLRKELVGEGFSDEASVRYAIQTYRLVYRTVDASGKPTTASGLVAFPERRAGRVLSAVSYTHGTELERRYTPSVGDDLWGPGPTHAYAAAGFAAVAPDYLGMGVGSGWHPYLHVPSETTATIDLLRAARTFAQQNGRTLTRDVYLTGFSQGASAATGIAKALHHGADRSFRVAALAPISGAYDLGRVEAPALLSGGAVPNPKVSVVYTSYWITAWNRIYGLYDDPSDVFLPPYDDGRVDRAFDGTHTVEEILETLPGNVKQLFTDEAFEMMLEPRGRMAKALREHDTTCSDWRPRTPVRLFYGSGDEEVLNANTTSCAKEFRASRAHVTTVDLGSDVDHLTSNRVGRGATVRWFSTLAH
jgi:hypothetical protein